MSSKKLPVALRGLPAAAAGLRLRVLDARGQVVGRLASQIATVLMGKDKPTYAPHAAAGDAVVVVNAAAVELTGRKWDGKLYRWHTGWPGGLRERSARDAHARDPGAVLRAAVLGMLPKNNLRRDMARRLRIYPGGEHPYSDADGAARGYTLARMEPPPRRVRDAGDLLELPEGFQPSNPEAYFKRFGVRLARKKAADEAAAAAAAAGGGGGG